MNIGRPRKPCKFFASGSCRKGDACEFPHVAGTSFGEHLGGPPNTGNPGPGGRRAISSRPRAPGPASSSIPNSMQPGLP